MVNAQTRKSGISILTVSDEDLLEQGFDPKNLTDEMFADIVRDLQKRCRVMVADTFSDVCWSVLINQPKS